MTMRQIRCGIACCGDCGAHLEIVCSAGCKDSEPQFQKDYSLLHRAPKLRGEKPTHCTYEDCTDPIAPRNLPIGRPPTTCAKHLEKGRREHGKPPVHELVFRLRNT